MKTKTRILHAAALLAALPAAAAPDTAVPPGIPASPAMPTPHAVPAPHITVPTVKVEQLTEPVRWKFLSGGETWETAVQREGPVTYLGVSSAPPPRELAPHLSIPEDTGLVVDFIAKDSPAEKAGLLPKDVLAMLDDQILIHPRQLAVLVANHKEGESVKITYVRKGRLQETSAVLGKQEAAAAAGRAGDTAMAFADVMLEAREGRPLKTFIRKLATPAEGESGAVMEIRRAEALMDEARSEDYRKELGEIRAMVEEIHKRLEQAEGN